MSCSLVRPGALLSTRRIPAARPRSQRTLVSPGAGRGQGPLPRDRESPCRSHWASFCAGCVALLGDPNQLLSVGAGNILSDLLTLGVPSICLQQQYRQSTDAAALRQNVVRFPKLNDVRELHGMTASACSPRMTVPFPTFCARRLRGVTGRARAFRSSHR